MVVGVSVSLFRRAILRLAPPDRESLCLLHVLSINNLLLLLLLLLLILPLLLLLLLLLALRMNLARPHLPRRVRVSGFRFQV